MKETRDTILNGVEAELDRRRIGSQSHFDKEEILARMDSLHHELLKKVNLCGQSSATALRNVQVADADEFFVNDSDDDPRPLTIVEASGASNSSRRFQFFYSGGEISRVPNDFEFPQMTLCTLITSWFCGNPSMQLLPFKFLKQRDLKNESAKSVFRKMSAMMDAVIKGAKKIDKWNPQSGTWEVPIALLLYKEVIPLFEYPTSAGHRIRRDKQMSWRTVYNLYLKMGKTFATDLDVAADATGVVEGSILTANETGVAMGGVSEPME
jgi:hypothetical protein